ncbi:sigma-70 family RNA polymerase sigma factor [Gemmatimonadota bacterium DH-20]|uniref:Sigma-70 family RNA polymerase sigma factor n=1 Tax=Gaopeijia maritima TaxID=3119007 RepID=A0ABU9E8A8_9BACT
MAFTGRPPSGRPVRRTSEHLGEAADIMGGVVDLNRYRASRGDAPLTRLARGETGAAEACIDAYGPLVQGLARKLLAEGSDIDDVVQSIFVELWRSAHTFDPDRASDRGFVAMIARRRIIDHRRRSDRRVETVPLAPARDRASDEHERTTGRVAAAPAIRALDRLPDDRRQWIVMSVVEGYSHSEIARETDTPLGTVKSGIRRGLLDMRAWLATPSATEEATP